jgi:cbb3-type cytochrome oxidase subunit 3
VTLFGQHFQTLSIFLIAVGIFFLAGVYSALRQGIKSLALLALLLAALAIAGGVLRL